MFGLKVSLSFAFAALSLAIGWIVYALRLPIYLDSVGIVLSAVILGFRYGALTAIATALIGTLVINPYLYAYSGTAVLIALVASFSYRLGGFDNALRSALTGLIIGVVAAAASAPVTAFLFSGNTMSGVDLITAYLRSTGRSLFESVWITGLTSEPVDKMMVAILSYFVLRSLPKQTMARHSLRNIPRAKTEA